MNDTRAARADPIMLPFRTQVPGANPLASCLALCKSQLADGCAAFEFNKQTSWCTMYARPLLVGRQTEAAADIVYMYKGTDLFDPLGGFPRLDLKGTNATSAPAECAAECDKVPGGACVAWQLEASSSILDTPQASYICKLFAQNLTGPTAEATGFRPGSAYGYISTTSKTNTTGIA